VIHVGMGPHEWYPRILRSNASANDPARERNTLRLECLTSEWLNVM
jgi:hypothetical protein